jgi:hypothetical protein
MFFNHGNLCLPDPVDRALRWLVVTPDMHRVHHSIVPAETNSNFGFTLPWWERLGGTYRGQPGAGHEQMTLGIEQFRDPRHLRLDQLLVQPLLEEGGATLGRGEAARAVLSDLRATRSIRRDGAAQSARPPLLRLVRPGAHGLWC